jgi:hypothetical protein
MTSSERASTAIHLLTDGVSRALDAVEAGTSTDRAAITRAQMTGLQIGMSPLGGVLVLPLMGLLSAAAIQLAERTGQDPEEVVAGWRQIAGNSLDAVAELLEQVQGGES